MNSIAICLTVIDPHGGIVAEVYPVFVSTPDEAESELRRFSGVPNSIPAQVSTCGSGPFPEPWYRTVLEPSDPAFQGHQFVAWRNVPPGAV